jgi:hypothetical protein
MGRSNTVRHHNTFRGIYLAADAAIRRRRARDAEPSEGELDNEPASAADLLEIVREWLVDMAPDEADELLEGMLEIKANHEREQAVDRAHRGVPGARRAHGAGDFHRPTRPAHAGDAALPHGVRPAHERFPGIAARVSASGWE